MTKSLRQYTQSTRLSLFDQPEPSAPTTLQRFLDDERGG